jgi:pimeloyl-ACP methyl ester carboxylesterase
VLTTTDRVGRQLAWQEYGDPGGTPLVLLHGTPGGRLAAGLHAPVFTDLGFRLLAPDRAGYGGTAALPARTVLSQADDVIGVLDAARVESAYVVGGSGGGPHALGVAVAAPDRVKGVGVLVGAVPLTADQVTGQVAFNQAAFAALDDLELLRTHVEEGRRTILEDGIEALMADAPASDRAARSLVADALAAIFADALAPGIDGMVDDYRALWHTPWGFDPEQVARPVLWAHGTEDRNVPYDAAAAFAQRLPSYELITWDGVGHAVTPDLLRDFLGRLVRS